MSLLTTILPPPEAETLDDLALQFVSGLAEGLADADEAVFEYEPLKAVQPIEHESRSGFWSWNNGGYEVCLPASLCSAWSKGSCPGPILSTIQSGNASIADEWNRQHPDKPPFDECAMGDHGEELQEAAHEWETEGWQSDDDCYFWKARAIFYAPDQIPNETGEPEVYLDCYLCADSYGRDNISWLSAYGSKTDQTSGGFKLTLPVRKFVKLTPAHIDRMVKTAMRKLPSFVNCG